MLTLFTRRPSKIARSAVQEIVLAAGRDDFAAVENAASRVGYSQLMGQMCTHMGAGAKGFAEQALAFPTRRIRSETPRGSATERP